MDYQYFIRQGLAMHSLPVYEHDIPYIHSILSTIKKSEASLQAFPTLNQELPITIVDKAALIK